MAHMASIRLEEIVSQLGGELIGDAATAVSRVATLQSAGPGDLSFLSQARYRRQLQSTRASAVVLPPSERDATNLPRIISADPYLYFAEVARLFQPPQEAVCGIHASAILEQGARVEPTAEVGAGAYIGRNARIGARAIIGPGCHVGEEAVIGEDSRLYPHVTIYQQCQVGRRAIVHSGAVIGADGFGLASKDGAWLKIPQTGRVLIGDDVEIGANTTIDRGALDDTVIEDGVKLDNQIQVGHNVRIGAHSALAGCVGIAGSARIGRHCTVGGGAIILGHLEVVDNVHISAATLITKSISKAGRYAGAYPFAEQRSWLRSAAAVRSLDELIRRVAALESELFVNGVKPHAIRRTSDSKSPVGRSRPPRKAKKG